MWEESKHPRDENGRFVEKGQEATENITFEDMVEFAKGGASVEIKKFVKEKPDIKKVMEESGVNEQEAKKSIGLAEKISDEASKVEPVITKDVVDAVKGVGGLMFGLDFRQKQVESMARKIGKDAKDNGLSLEESADEIKDAVRFTAIFNENDFVNNYNKVKSELAKSGYREIRCRNYWEKFLDGKSDQKAVQCVFEDKNGYRFEFQFHTFSSIGVKEKHNHKRYEELRQPNTSDERKRELSKEMREMGRNIPDVKDIRKIKDYEIDEKKEMSNLFGVNLI